MQLQDIVGIVTGGAAGIGRALAETILSAGGNVLITDINTSLLETTGQELAAKFGKANVGWTQQNVVEMDSFHRIFDVATNHFKKPVNLLINNAGIGGDLDFWKGDAPRNWEDVITIDLTAVIRGSQVAIQQFRKHLGGNEGVVINVSSAAGFMATPFFPQYGAAKAGVIGFTRSCHPLKKQHNIRVVALCPAFVDSALSKLAIEVSPKLIQRLGGVMDVSKVVDGFEMALNDPNNSGRCILIVPTGSSYFPFAGDKHLYPEAKL
ncbi:hypothetical protein Poli38472_008986 [Pythium oligandrum]|uniref:Uncharacterized protein n=1 Tax=Pythium oligandrum TaxID=41045 RepID=A0A8K1CKN0_PYTOL|nr:hypothetical protein Poli38472_008986 [Pythium oligandrum]|eukprot:TMW64819.1 hypothetical protein Poli38472_008986 [Pythium oligandrum]